MSDALEIDGKKLHPIKEAAQLVSYSRDYVTRLARENKIVATTVGRQWFVDLGSLKQYAEQSAHEQEFRKKQLSAERKQERQLRQAVDKKLTEQQKRVRFLHVRAAVMMMFVLGSGLLTGLIINHTASVIGINVAELPSYFVNSDGRWNPTPANSVATVAETNQDSLEGGIADFIDSEYRTQSLRPIGDVDNGILILPSGATTITAEEIFSDRVVVREGADGTQVVVRLDAEGNETGVELPFAVIPVNQESK